MRGTSEPQTGFYRTFRTEPPFLGYPFKILPSKGVRSSGSRDRITKMAGATHQRRRLPRAPFSRPKLLPRVVIFFSLTEAPLPDPTPTPPNTPKRETDPNRPKRQRSRNGAEIDRNQALWGGMAGRFVGMGGWGL